MSAGKRNERVSAKAKLSKSLVVVEQHYICYKIVELNYIHCIVLLLIHSFELRHMLLVSFNNGF